MKPPASTPNAVASRNTVSAAFATDSVTPYSDTSATTEKLVSAPVDRLSSAKNATSPSTAGVTSRRIGIAGRASGRGARIDPAIQPPRGAATAPPRPRRARPPTTIAACMPHRWVIASITIGASAPPR